MSISVIKGDILNLPKEFDVIAIPGRFSLQLTGYLGEQVKKICGPKLELDLSQYKTIALGKCVITEAYNLNYKKIIHIANPKYSLKNIKKAQKQLKDSYFNALELAKSYGYKSIAFAFLSTGVYGYPLKEASEIALSTMKEFLIDNDMDIALVIHTNESFNECEDIFKKYSATIVDGELVNKDYKRIKDFKEKDETDTWYSEMYEKEKINPQALEVSKVFKKIQNTNNFKEVNKTEKVYDGVCGKQTYYNLINGTKTPERERLIGLAVNLGFSIAQVDELLSVVYTKLNPLDKREREILDFIDKNYRKCSKKKQINPSGIEELNDHLVRKKFKKIIDKVKNEDD